MAFPPTNTLGRSSAKLTPLGSPVTETAAAYGYALRPVLVSAMLVEPKPPSGTCMVPGVSVMSKASRSCTVKGVLLVAVPRELVTVMKPVVARVGTIALSKVALPLATTATMPLNRTWLFETTGSNPIPLIATAIPTGPALGLNEVMASCRIVKVIEPGSRRGALPVSVKIPPVFAVSVKLALVPPWAIVTALGKLAVPVPVATSVTTRPPAGAGSLEATVTVVLVPARRVVVGAVSTSATGCFTVNKVLVETVTLWPVALATKLKLAPMVLDPAASALARPAALMVATLVLLEVQVTRAVKSWLVPSVMVPVA